MSINKSLKSKTESSEYDMLFNRGRQSVQYLTDSLDCDYHLVISLLSIIHQSTEVNGSSSDVTILVDSLLKNGKVLVAVSLLLGLNQVENGIEILLDNQMFLEAILCSVAFKNNENIEKSLKCFANTYAVNNPILSVLVLLGLDDWDLIITEFNNIGEYLLSYALIDLLATSNVQISADLKSIVSEKIQPIQE
ncbi:hypothetical protein GEMRC1_003248 [Eukaryota sp. GEM-RC1]